MLLWGCRLYLMYLCIVQVSKIFFLPFFVILGGASSPLPHRSTVKNRFRIYGKVQRVRGFRNGG